MPKEITHIYFADKIFEKIDEPIRNFLKVRKNVYYYGSVAPDLFYYYLEINRKFSEVGRIDIGEIIHDSPENLKFLHELAKKIRNSDEIRNILFPFLSGFLTHVAADTYFHPYIYHITGNYHDNNPIERKQSQKRHRLYETCMDLFILKNFYKTDIPKFRLSKKLKLTSYEKDIILGEYIKSIKYSYNIDFDESLLISYIHFCYRNYRRIIRIFQFTNLWNLILKFKFIERNIRDYSVLFYANHKEYNQINFNKFEFTHPISGDYISFSFEDLENKIIERGIHYIKALYEFIKDPFLDNSFIYENIPHISLNSGMISKYHTNFKHFQILPVLQD